MFPGRCWRPGCLLPLLWVPPEWGPHGHMAKMSRQPHREPCGSHARPQQQRPRHVHTRIQTHSTTPSNPSWGRVLVRADHAPLGAAGVSLLVSPIAVFQFFILLQDFAWTFMPSLEGYPAQTCLLTFQPCCSKDPAPVPRGLRGPGAVSWPHSHTVLTPSLSSGPAISGTDTGAGVSIFHSSARPCAAHRGSSHPHVRQ